MSFHKWWLAGLDQKAGVMIHWSYVMASLMCGTSTYSHHAKQPWLQNKCHGSLVICCSLFNVWHKKYVLTSCEAALITKQVSRVTGHMLQPLWCVAQEVCTHITQAALITAYLLRCIGSGKNIRAKAKNVLRVSCQNHCQLHSSPWHDKFHYWNPSNTSLWSISCLELLFGCTKMKIKSFRKKKKEKKERKTEQLNFAESATT